MFLPDLYFSTIFQKGVSPVMNHYYFVRQNVRTTKPVPSAIIPYIDVTIVLRGVLHYYMNGEPIEVRGGEAIVYQPGDHRVRTKGGAAEYFSFNITLNDPSEAAPFHGHLTGCVTEEILTILRLCEGFHGVYSSHAMEKSKYCFLMLYYILYEKYNESKQNTYVSTIKEFIAEHIGKPLTLSEISGTVFLSPNYCNHIFKSQTGETITDYVLRVKMEQARHLLLTSPLSLTDIASALGYKEYSYFSRIFKKESGLSPSAFRRSAMYTNYAVDEDPFGELIAPEEPIK